MLHTLFYSRLRTDLPASELAQYRAFTGDLLAHVKAEHPGFVDLETFEPGDGRRLSIVRFRDADSQRAWATDPRHLEAMRIGSERWYQRYRIVVCEQLRERVWTTTFTPDPPDGSTRGRRTPDAAGSARCASPRRSPRR